MKISHRDSKTLLVLLLVGLAAMGCASNPTRTRPAAAAPAGKPATVQVAPAQPGAAPARITMVRAEYRFVVIDFSPRPLPPPGTRLTVYRAGKPVGAVQITEPVRAQFATADILEGDLRAGDEAR